MDSLKNVLLNWIDELENYRIPEWDSLPDIDLYMDQVITYLERQLSIFAKSESEKFITPAMINNYVKNEIIPRPSHKKYTREHIAQLMTILYLKQVLSLIDINNLISHETSDKPINILVEQLNSIQFDAFKKTSVSVREALKSLDSSSGDNINAESLSLLALKFALEANANRIAAKKILDELTAYKSRVHENSAFEKEKTNGIKEKEKDKNKDKNK